MCHDIPSTADAAEEVSLQNIAEDMTSSILVRAREPSP